MKLFMVMTYDPQGRDETNTNGPFRKYYLAEDYAQEYCDENPGYEAIVYAIEGDTFETRSRCDDCNELSDECTCCSECVYSECQCESDEEPEEIKDTKEDEEDIFS